MDTYIRARIQGVGTHHKFLPKYNDDPERREP
jgi:hypothetical protein